MKAVGIDIGFSHTGVVFADVLPLEDSIAFNPIYAECIHTDRLFIDCELVGKRNLLRASHTYGELLRLMEEWNPDVLAIEVPEGSSQSDKAAKAMGNATGTSGALMATYRHLSLIQVRPGSVKRVVNPDKKAKVTKNECMDKVRALHPNFNWPKTKRDFEHVADGMLVLEASKPVIKL